MYIFAVELCKYRQVQHLYAVQDRLRLPVPVKPKTEYRKYTREL